jgi:hypothetical protein
MAKFVAASFWQTLTQAIELWSILTKLYGSPQTNRKMVVGPPVPSFIRLGI